MRKWLEPDRARPILGAAGLGFVPLLVAVLLTAVAARIDGVSFAEAVLLPADGVPPFRFLIGLGAWIAGAAGIYFAPGLLLVRALATRLPSATAYTIAAFVLSVFALTIGWAVARGLLPGLAGRSCLYLTVAVVDVLALAAAALVAPEAPALPRSAEGSRDCGSWRAELLVPVAGILLTIAAAWILMPGKITGEALEGDATEVYGFARSLFDGPLPSWDLESGVWGFYPTFVFVAYPVFFSVAIAGGIEAAVRLPALLFFGMTLLAVADLAARGRTRAAAGSLNVLLPFLVTGYLSLQIGAYYAGYHPFHGDLGCSPLEEWIVTALAFGAMLLVRDGAPGLAAIAAFLSMISFASGFPFVLAVGATGLVFLPSKQRRTLLRAALILAALLVAWAIFFAIRGLADGTLGPTLAEWWAKYFAGRGEVAAESPVRMIRALGWWALLAGGLAAVGLPLALIRGDRMAKWMAALGLAWVGFFVLSPNKNIHYFMPAAFLPLAAAIRATAVTERRSAPALAFAILMTISAALSAALCRPDPVAPYVADREFGRRTFFIAASEREAVSYTRALFNLTTPLSRWKPGRHWTIGRHTWVMYADRGAAPEREYDFYVGRVKPAGVEGLLEVTRIGTADGGTAYVWARGGRAAFRDWKSKTFPLRRDLSRFNFEM